MTKTFYPLLGAGVIALAAFSSEPAAAQSKYKVSPMAPGVGSGSGLKAKPPSDHGNSIVRMNKKVPKSGSAPSSGLKVKPPKDHGNSIVHMNKKAQGMPVGRRQHLPMARRR